MSSVIEPKLVSDPYEVLAVPQPPAGHAHRPPRGAENSKLKLRHPPTHPTTAKTRCTKLPSLNPYLSRCQCPPVLTERVFVSAALDALLSLGLPGKAEGDVQSGL